MKKLILLSLAVIATLASIGSLWHFRKTDIFSFLHLPSTSVEAPAVLAQVTVPPITQSYKNDTFRLSFKYPEGYSVREVSNEGATSILVENPKDGKGIQIQVSAYTDTDTVITPERVTEEVPDLVVDDPQPINVSAGGGTGLAFASDNPDFGGSSREAWFVVAGRLYQVSTYTQYDEVLKAVFSTWSFN